jgi:hypothetical protein
MPSVPFDTQGHHYIQPSYIWLYRLRILTVFQYVNSYQARLVF